LAMRVLFPRASFVWLASFVLASFFSGVVSQANCTGDGWFSLKLNATTIANYAHCTSLDFSSGVAITLNQNDNLSLPNLVSVTKTFTIVFASEAATMNLPVLANLTGTLSVHGMGSQSTLTMPSLWTVGDSLSFYSTKMAVIRLPKLQTVAKSITFASCSGDMTSQTAFPALTTIGQTLQIQSASQDVSLNDFPSLTSLTSLRISENRASVVVSGFAKLTNLTYLSVSQNTQKVALSGFDAVNTTMSFQISPPYQSTTSSTTINGFGKITNVIVLDAQAPVVLSGLTQNIQTASRIQLEGLNVTALSFPSLTTVTDKLALEDSTSSFIGLFPALNSVQTLQLLFNAGKDVIKDSFNAPNMTINYLDIRGGWFTDLSNSFNGVTSIGQASLYGLEKLTRIVNSFQSLERVEGHFTMNNVGVKSMFGSFGKLHTIRGQLTLDGTALPSLDAFYALEFIGSIELTLNTYLTSISGLCNLRSLNSTKVDMTYNYALCCNDITQLYDKAFITLPSNTSLTIAANKCSTRCPSASKGSVCSCARMTANGVEPCAGNATAPYCAELRHGPICSAIKPPSGGGGGGGVPVTTIVIIVACVAVVALVLERLRRKRQARQRQQQGANHDNGNGDNVDLGYARFNADDVQDNDRHHDVPNPHPHAHKYAAPVPSAPAYPADSAPPPYSAPYSDDPLPHSNSFAPLG